MRRASPALNPEVSDSPRVQSFPGQKLFLMVLAVGLSAAALADEPRAWLERMNKALMTRNYDGVFSHWQGRRRDVAHHPSRGRR